VTIGLSAKEPQRLKAAAITAGGISMRSSFASEEQAAQLRVPMCILHGGNDGTVNPETSAKLKEILDRDKVPNERHVFEGVGHNLHQDKAEDIHRLMQAWFTKHGVLRK
jgi:predicted esterase